MLSEVLLNSEDYTDTLSLYVTLYDNNIYSNVSIATPRLGPCHTGGLFPDVHHRAEGGEGMSAVLCGAPHRGRLHQVQLQLGLRLGREPAHSPRLQPLHVRTLAAPAHHRRHTGWGPRLKSMLFTVLWVGTKVFVFRILTNV